MIKSELRFGDFTEAAKLIQSRLLKASVKGADAAGKVYEAGYKAAVPEHLPTGTYGSAGARHHFVQLMNAIGRRTLEFQDKTGAYSVVGVVTAPNNWRSLAPQGLWIEYGTDERTRKSDGQETGFVPAYHILRTVAERYAAAAQNSATAAIKREMDK